MRTTCTRVSTLAKTLDDASGLHSYIASTTLEAIHNNPDLYRRLQLIDGPWRAYKPLHEAAQERRGKVEAEQGTNVHMAVSAILNGHLPLFRDEGWLDAESVLSCVEQQGWTVLGNEQLVVTLGLAEPLAGTFDLLLKTERGLVIADVKTVSSPSDARALSWAVQMACYAHGAPYVGEQPVERDRWTRPILDLDAIGIWPEPPRRDVGIVLEVTRGTAQCTPRLVDIGEGWACARLAVAVRRARKAADGLLLQDWT